MNATKNIVESFREVVQNLLVPELKFVKISIDSLRTEMQSRDENQTRTIQHLSQKLDFTIDIRERLASL